MVSARRFRQVFIDQWNHDLHHNGQALLAAYPNDGDWTAYMGVFLRRIATSLNLSMKLEWNNLDAIYYHAETDLFPTWLIPYPTRLEVYVEHENGEYPEEEMYKLLMWPASLKVLMFYDWPEEAKATEHRRNWLSDKLTTMFSP